MPMPRVLAISWEGVRFLMSEVPLYLTNLLYEQESAGVPRS